MPPPANSCCKSAKLAASSSSFRGSSASIASAAISSGLRPKGTGKVHTFSWVRVPRNPAFKEDVPICYINVILDEGVIMESRLVGKGIDNVKLGDKVKVSFQETHDPGIKLPVFELVSTS